MLEDSCRLVVAEFGLNTVRLVTAFSFRICNSCSIERIIFRKQIKGNDSQWLETTFKYLGRYRLGEIIVCSARSLHACMTYSCYSWLSRFDISARFPVVTDLLFFLKTKAFARCSTEILVFTQWSKMPVAAFNVNHVWPFKYRTRHSEIEQNSDLHLAWRKIKPLKNDI